MSGKSEITFAERRLRRERGVWVALLGLLLAGLFATCASEISSGSHRSVSAASAGSILQTTTETKSTSTSKKRGAPWKKVRR
jgi:hypothetical protein